MDYLSNTQTLAVDGGHGQYETHSPHGPSASASAYQLASYEIISHNGDLSHDSPLSVASSQKWYAYKS